MDYCLGLNKHVYVHVIFYYPGHFTLLFKVILNVIFEVKQVYDLATDSFAVASGLILDLAIEHP